MYSFIWAVFLDFGDAQERQIAHFATEIEQNPWRKSGSPTDAW